MKFLSIELEHVFAYDEKATIDLSGTTEEQNIVLIWGRNGMGKTSFLNALKLLFTGVASPLSRTVGFPPHPLGERQYIVGDGAGWSGLINRRARRRAERDGRPVTARVMARWEIDGQVVTAEREWTYNNGSVSENLVVIDGTDRFVREAAEARLEDFLPKDFVGFFFFDGEDIKSLAESAERKQEDFDRLLRITYVSQATEELKRVVTERQRQMINQGLDELPAVEAKVAENAGTRKLLTDQIARYDEELLNDTIELRRLTVRRENLSTGASEAQRAMLEARRISLTQELADASNAVVETVPATAPILANLGLVRSALEAVEARLAAAGAAEVIFVRKVREDLPTWISDAPTSLPADQVTVLSNFIGEKLGELVASPPETGLFAKLELGRADRLRASLLRWATLGPDRRSLQVADLADASRLRKELQQVSDALMEIEVGSQANLEEYKKVVADITTLEERLAELNQKKGNAQARHADATKAASELADRLADLQARSDEAAKGFHEVQFFNAVVRTLNEVAEGLRKGMRTQIEARINERFGLLLTDHPLIDRIKLDENYTMFFLDSGGQAIGRSSLSSGLKQLAATALLWAMKDVAGYVLPVVIDTPLGRIDRQNQRNLLARYYPFLSHQVIILPTDAEIDKTKLGLLAPRVWREYSLENQDTGESTRIVPTSLVGGAHG